MADALLLEKRMAPSRRLSRVEEDTRSDGRCQKGEAMNVGIGLPNAVRGVDREGIVDWAQRAERAGFASLGTIDRLVYPGYESLIALAAAAAVTERVELVTDILIAPLRANAALLAKQAATIDSLSGGRLTLGLAVGGRADDFAASGVDFRQRGRIFEQQLQEMTAVWSGERGIGPAPRQNGRPGLLIGGRADVAYQRAARHADGWTMGGGSPDAFKEAQEKLTGAWASAGRRDRPRTMALFYFALGDDAERMASDKLGDYYAFLGDYAQQIIASAAKDADTVKQYIAGFEAAGADDVICFPASSDAGQVDRLAEAAL
jgi:alkanesulfonate monooxygenase SsuD/methylene tetrahydromethanopterin reductase-like flavin-dependent oxidoreductase (luciferase family)